MFSKFFTVVVIPQKTSKVSKFKISVSTFFIGGISIILIFSVWGWVFFDYFSIRSKLVYLTAAKQKYEDQKTRLEEYKNRSKEFEYHLDRLNELNYKLRVLTSLEVQRKSIMSPGETQTHYGNNKEESLSLLEKKAKEKGILAIIDTNIEKADNNNEKKDYFKNLTTFLESRKSLLNRIPNRWPIRGFLTSGFGLRSDPFTGQLTLHQGLDIATKSNSPIYAPADGIVIFAGDDEFLGNLLEIDHGAGLVTKYGHTAYFTVSVGQIVKRGDVIARIGSTGRSTGPHLHYEVIFNGIPQNPIKYISESSIIPSYLD